MSGLTQIHDFNPGVSPFPTGLFWTVAIPPGSVHFNLGAKTASLDLSHTKIDDYGDVASALTKDQEIASGSIDVELEWHGGSGPTSITDTSNGNHFKGEFVDGSASLRWSASEPGFEFDSGVGHSGFARIGHERNGSFF